MTPSDVTARRLARAHDVLLALLIPLRVLLGVPQTLPEAEALWSLLVGLGLLLCALELRLGLRDGLRWGPAGLIAAAVLALLVPAAARGADPATTWGLWGGWACLLAFAAYLAQVLPGRRRLALALLLAAVGTQALLALMQRLVVLPAMRAAVEHPTDAGMAAAVQRFGAGALIERIERGGAFGSLGLANALASLLVMGGLLAAGAWTRRAGRAALAMLLALCIAGLLAAQAKGALAGLGIGLAVAAALHGRGWLRWTAPALVAIGGAGIWASGLLDASIRVRTGYWQAALDLVREAPLLGHGLGGFAARAGALLPPEAEFSRQVHNEVLEAAVAGGVAAALALALLLLALLRRPVEMPADEADTADRRALWAIPAGFAYLGLFGFLASDNLAFWPGGDIPGLPLLWAVLLGGATALATRALLGLGRPPAWAWRAAAAAGAASCLFDFNLHQTGWAGALVVIAAAAGSSRRCAATPQRVLLGAIASAGLVLALAAGSWRSGDLTRAAGILGHLEDARRLAMAGRDEDADRHRHDAALLSGIEIPDLEQRARPEWRQQAEQRGLEEATDLLAGWPEARDLRLRAALLGEDQAALRDLATRLPWHPDVQAALAELAVRDHDWDAALACLERAVALAPNTPRLHRRLADILDVAARRGDGPAGEALRARAQRERAEAERLDGILHPSQRPLEQRR